MPPLNEAIPPLLAIEIGLLVLLAASTLDSRGAAWDARLFGAINGRYLPPAVEFLVRLVSHFGLLPTNLLVWGLIGFRFGPRIGLIGAAGLLLAWLICRILKARVGRTRPYFAVRGARLVGLESSGSAFPSSHVAMSLFTATVLTQAVGDVPAALLIALVVAYARIYLGAHYPRDVLGGAAIGLGTAMLTLVALHVLR